MKTLHNHKLVHPDGTLLLHSDGADTCKSHQPGDEIRLSLFDLRNDYERKS